MSVSLPASRVSYQSPVPCQPGRRAVRVSLGVVVTVAIVLAMAACASPGTDESTDAATEPVGSWELSWWDDATSLAGSQVTLIVTSDEVAGSSACNAYRGSLALDGGAFHIDPLATTTYRICLGTTGEIESIYISLLGSVDSWSLNGTDLVLSANGFPTLRYRPS